VVLGIAQRYSALRMRVPIFNKQIYDNFFNMEIFFRASLLSMCNVLICVNVLLH